MIIDDLVMRAADRGIRIGIMEQRALLQLPHREPNNSDSKIETRESGKTQIIKAGPFTLDVSRGVLETPYRTPNIIELTPIMTRFAALVMRTPGQIIPLTTLVEQGWPNGDGDQEQVKTYFSHLRKRSGDPSEGSRTRHFRNKVKFGYYFNE